MKVSPKFEKACVLYAHFAKSMGATLHPDDMEKQFVFESQGGHKYAQRYGEPFDADNNFYAIGKKWKEWHVTNWLEDMDKSKPFLFSAGDLWMDYADFPEMIELLETAVYPQLSPFQKSLVDATREPKAIHSEEVVTQTWWQSLRAWVMGKISQVRVMEN